jgi:hypothetical protein
MSRRTPLVVAVVGALLVGGATTGTTLAQWRDQAAMPAGGITSGSMSHAVEDPGSALELTAGSGVTTTVLVRDTSSAAARNLRQTIRIRDVALVDPTSGLSRSNLSLSVERKPWSGCSTPGSGPDRLPRSLGTTSPGETIEVCLAVVADASTPTSAGSLRLDLAAEQVRPDGSPAGWTSESIATISLTVAAPTLPSTPTVACHSGKGATFGWTEGGSYYKVYRAAESSGPFTVVSTQTAAEYTDSGSGFSKNEVRFFRVRAVNASGESVDSQVVLIERNGSSDNYKCSVTP